MSQFQSNKFKTNLQYLNNQNESVNKIDKKGSLRQQKYVDRMSKRLKNA